MSSAAVHAVSTYGVDGPSARVRLHEWFDRVGVKPQWHAYAGFADNRPARLLRAPARTALAEAQSRSWKAAGATVVMCREASPLSRGPLEERLLRTAGHGVLDFDDAIYLPAGLARNVLSQPPTKFAKMARAADVVIAGSEVLAEHACRLNRDVRVIPSCIKPGDYRPKNSWERSGAPRLVWLGSPSTEAFVAAIADPLLEVHRRTGARLTLISGPKHNPELDRLAPMLDRRPWNLATMPEVLAGADIAIAPLTDTPFARGKCAYKLLQYAATALPIVGSPIGANRHALQRFDGVCVERHADWSDALVQVIAEPTSRRASRGLAARRAVKEHYSFDAWEAAWRSATGLN